MSCIDTNIAWRKKADWIIYLELCKLELLMIDFFIAENDWINLFIKNKNLILKTFLPFIMYHHGTIHQTLLF